MNIEEYKKQLSEWKNEHTDFYNEYVHALKSKRSTLATYMHVYEFAIKQIPNLPSNIELGACDDLFNIYYEKYGFSKLIGMLASVIGNDKFFGIKSLIQRNKLKKAIAAWLILGDLHSCIINKIISYPNNNNYEDSLYKLLCRIIKNSFIAEIKDEKYWRSVQRKKQLFSKDKEMDGILVLIKNEIAESNDSETFPQKNLAKEKRAQSVQREKQKPGKEKFKDFEGETLEKFIEYSTGNQNKAKIYTPKIVEQLTKCSSGEDLAALAVALEHLDIILCLDNGGVSKFWNLLYKKHNSIKGYRAMNNSYNKLKNYNKNGIVPADCASGMSKIKDYIKIFQETKNELENGVQETSIDVN